MFEEIKFQKITAPLLEQAIILGENCFSYQQYRDEIKVELTHWVNLGSVPFIDIDGNAFELLAYYAVFLEEQIAGIAGLYHEFDDGIVDNSCVWVGWLCIKPSLQKKGLGKSVVTFLKNLARSYEVKYLKVFAVRELVGFYEKLDFQLTGETMIIYQTAPIEVFVLQASL